MLVLPLLLAACAPRRDWPEPPGPRAPLTLATTRLDLLAIAEAIARDAPDEREAALAAVGLAYAEAGATEQAARIARQLGKDSVDRLHGTTIGFGSSAAVLRCDAVFGRKWPGREIKQKRPEVLPLRFQWPASVDARRLCDHPPRALLAAFDADPLPLRLERHSLIGDQRLDPREAWRLFQARKLARFGQASEAMALLRPDDSPRFREALRGNVALGLAEAGRLAEAQARALEIGGAPELPPTYAGDARACAEVQAVMYRIMYRLVLTGQVAEASAILLRGLRPDAPCRYAQVPGGSDAVQVASWLVSLFMVLDRRQDALDLAGALPARPRLGALLTLAAQ